MCLKCGLSTSNPKFCTRSCAASYNNTQEPKRKPLHECKNCGSAINARSWYCKPCKEVITSSRSIANKRLGDYKSANANTGMAPYIREHARKTYIQCGRPLICTICLYDKHVDICHIKPVSSFTDDTYISTINDMSNLIALCKNHHWELDNGFLVLTAGVEPA